MLKYLTRKRFSSDPVDLLNKTMYFSNNAAHRRGRKETSSLTGDCFALRTKLLHYTRARNTHFVLSLSPDTQPTDRLIFTLISTVCLSSAKTHIKKKFPLRVLLWDLFCLSIWGSSLTEGTVAVGVLDTTRFLCSVFCHFRHFGANMAVWFKSMQ